LSRSHELAFLVDVHVAGAVVPLPGEEDVAFPPNLAIDRCYPER
jgi:hypothetical protein